MASSRYTNKQKINIVLSTKLVYVIVYLVHEDITYLLIVKKCLTMNAFRLNHLLHVIKRLLCPLLSLPGITDVKYFGNEITLPLDIVSYYYYAQLSSSLY